jgi:hypothetical protein
MNAARGFIFLAIGLIIACCTRFKEERHQSDYENYLAQIRETKMSEMAKGDLETIASILLGQISLSCVKDKPTGFYVMQFRGTSCTLPKADEATVKKLAEENQKAMEDEAKKLKPIADADSSGFVSTEEAYEFRTLVELGYQISTITSQEGNNFEAVVKGTGLSKGELSRKLQAYALLIKKMVSAGLKPPPEIVL